MRRHVKFTKRIFFKPWIGNQYWSRANLFGMRVLIVGESAYDWQPRAGPTQWRKPKRDHVHTCIHEQVDGDWSRSFETLIAHVFLGAKPHSISTKAKFWNSVALHEYLQMSVGRGRRARKESWMWDASHTAFREMLEKLAPDCIIFLGCGLWENAGGGGTEGRPLRRCRRQTWMYPTPRGRAFATYINHPTGSVGFSTKKWHAVVKEAIEYARSYRRGR